MTTALVTGATRGLGLATTRALAQQGACVLLSGRRYADAEQAATALRGEGLDVRAVELDVTSTDSIESAVMEITETQGRLDVLVNNAGILPEATDPAEHEFADVELFRATFETNLFGAVAVIETFLPLLRKSAAARIVNVSSTMGSHTDQANPDSAYYQMSLPAYRSSKAALNSVTIALAKALAETDILVTSVCPGFVQTELTPSNKDLAPLTAEQAARIVVTAATLPAAATSGTFIDQDGVVDW
jgi:NAD(P)-dependent dehydrogenase (short-subunit alcohol dehydrogenase family)